MNAQPMIVTKYKDGTDQKVPRFTARVHNAENVALYRVELPCSYELGAIGNHMLACAALKAKLGWDAAMVGGFTRAGEMMWTFKFGSPEVK